MKIYLHNTLVLINDPLTVKSVVFKSALFYVKAYGTHFELKYLPSCPHPKEFGAPCCRPVYFLARNLLVSVLLGAEAGLNPFLDIRNSPLLDIALFFNNIASLCSFLKTTMGKETSKATL
jgi:hypothetical protein